MQNEKKSKKVYKKNESINAAIQIAVELFMSKGIENVKMTDIADEADIGVASLYRYFKTKENLAVRAGVYMWQDLHALFDVIYEEKGFYDLPGIVQVQKLFYAYKTLFNEYPGFIRFIAEFDEMAIRTKPDPEYMAEYEKSVLNFYPRFLKSFETGIFDKSIKKDVQPLLFYTTVNHAVTALAQKLLRGNVLQSDRFDGNGELELLLDISLDYLKNNG